MEENPNKKQEFTKYKELFTQKVYSQALEHIKLIKITTDEFDKQTSSELGVNTKQSLSSKGVITNVKAKKLIKNKLKAFKTENPEAKLFEKLKLTFNETIQEGDQFCAIKDLKCVFEEKSESLEHKEGIVYLINFWDTQCEPCQEMLEKNEEKWKGKVEIYGVSLDENLADIKKRVEDKKWHSIHHYQIEKSISNYEIDEIPTIYIIDQKGMVVYNGHPMSINVEEFINKLLEKSTEDKPKADKLTKEKYKEMKTEIEQFMKKTITKEDKFTLNITFKKKKIFDSKWNVLKRKYNNPALSYVVKIKHNDKLQKLLQQIYDKYPKDTFKIKKEYIFDRTDQIENCVKFATSQLVANGLTSIPTLNLTAQNKLKFNKRQKQGIIFKNHKLQFGSDKPFPPSDAEKLKKFKEELQSFKSKAKFEEDVQILNSLNAYSENVSQIEEKVQKGVITEEKFNQLVAIQKEYLPIIRQKIKEEDLRPTLLFKITKTIKYDLEGKIIGQPIYIAKKFVLEKMYDTQYNKIKEFGEFVEKIEKIVKKEDFELEFTLELEKAVTVEFGKECDNCKKALTPTDKQYYCYFHNIWICYECGNKIDETKKGNSKYIHPCNMVYINVINDTGMKNIDEYKFGENIQFDEDYQMHYYCCNGCQNNGLERYICLTCRPGPMKPCGLVDICEDCQTLLNERNVEIDEYKTVKKNVTEKHDEQTHILLRVVFGQDNYFDY